jgi:Ca2+-binding EF-hand superfamily protein
MLAHEYRLEMALIPPRRIGGAASVLLAFGGRTPPAPQSGRTDQMNNRLRIALAAGLLGLAGVGGIVPATAGQGDWGHGKGRHHGMKMNDMGSGWHRGGARMLHMLENLDTNKDKKLTQEEIDAARQALLAAHDANKDGQLTLQEFEAVWLEQMRQMVVRQFQRLDKDGNATVTAAEFAEPLSGLVARMDRNDDGILDKSDRERRRGMMRNRDRGGDGEQLPPAEDAAPTEGTDPN